ncbi:MAG: TIM barrel protein [Hyphomicrobiales bacterium]|jgi:sugar phosphate isomerase/epimerase
MVLGLGSYTFRWSIGHKGLNPPEPLAATDLLDVAKAHDLSVVQYADNCPLHLLAPGELASLKSKADAFGIAIELGTQSFNAQEVEDYIAIGQSVGAKILRVALDGPDAKTPIADLAAAFQALLPKARDAGLRIAIENHFNYPSPRLVQLLDAIDDDGVGVCLDVANSICAGEWPMETVAMLAEHAINLHLKDYVIVPDPFGVGFVIHGCPLGQGRADSRAVLDAMPTQDMTVIMEHWLPRLDDMADARRQENEWLKQSLDYARKQLGL